MPRANCQSAFSRKKRAMAEGWSVGVASGGITAALKMPWVGGAARSAFRIVIGMADARAVAFANWPRSMSARADVTVAAFLICTLKASVHLGTKVRGHRMKK